MTEVFRAVWPIVNNTAAGPTDEELIQQALRDLPNVATRHHVRIEPGPKTAYIAPAAHIPGSGGQGTVLIIDAPATKTPPRPYHRKATP